MTHPTATETETAAEDPRASAAADIDVQIAKHKPDEDGYCVECPVEDSPCDSLIMLEKSRRAMAMKRAAHAAAQDGGTAPAGP